jgi:hypothetical protein
MQRSVRGTLARSLAAASLVFLYSLGIVGVSGVTTAAPAEARRGGRRGRGGGRGRRGSRGRRGGRGGGIYFGAPFLYGGYDDGCYWSPRRARWVCPYYPYYW